MLFSVLFWSFFKLETVNAAKQKVLQTQIQANRWGLFFKRQILQGRSQDFSRGRGHTVSKWGYSPDCHYGQDIVIAFSPPVVGWLVKKALQKGGSRAPQDPPGYALVLHQESMEWSIPNWTKHCPKTELCKTRCLTTAAETSKQTHMKLNLYQWSKKLGIDRAICGKRFPRCRGARKHGQRIWTSEAADKSLKRKKTFPRELIFEFNYACKDQK